MGGGKRHTVRVRDEERNRRAGLPVAGQTEPRTDAGGGVGGHAGPAGRVDIGTAATMQPTHDEFSALRAQFLGEQIATQAPARGFGVCMAIGCDQAGSPAEPCSRDASRGRAARSSA